MYRQIYSPASVHSIRGDRLLPGDFPVLVTKIDHQAQFGIIGDDLVRPAESKPPCHHEIADNHSKLKPDLDLGGLIERTSRS
ncbi:hypothetical protein Mp_4g04550 [Marchantia polymorpha subsp. ruderalis]|uniref:Uncharacterized protein n=2 Tax=Marchantia polymorpha TaxID=3197 RepID=A0AAF6B6C6_MARPO|nr:hypothetical protein MARPO_0044s0019 [Marchantia polymorpha]BBN07560.1 hypothetical protein Mp_4g04550 [Marchantia polymorpha subsp. ruderalis]|eukprot:PTQ39540.1 hypothetical protein MARPO_0044s0019 [Marchantia polymorpha]